MRQTIITVFLFALFSLVFFQMTGCRLIGGYSDDTPIPVEQTYTMSLAGKIILPATTADAASIRQSDSENLIPGVTVSGDLLLAGVEVWIDELPNFPHQFTDDQGKYLFNGLPQGSFHVVAAYKTSSQQIMKVRSNPFEIAAASSSEIIIVPDMTLKEANKVVTGVLRDDSGNFMPEGTVLVLWGEKFTVGVDGTFTSPPLPDDVATAPLIVMNPPQAPVPPVLQPVTDLPQVQIQFVSTGQPTTVDLQVVKDITKPQPVAATVSISRNGQMLAGTNNRVYPGEKVELSVTLLNLDYNFPGLSYEWDAGRGVFAPVQENTASATWVVPETAGLATISVRISAPDRGFAKLFIPLSVEIQLPNPVYKVSFDARGGSAVAPALAVKGDKIADPAPPVREGFTFGGWYKESTCINPWNFVSDTVSDNTKLFARWIANAIKTVQVIFDSAGGNTVAPRNVVPGEKLIEPALPVRSGYAFAGWYKNAEMTTKWDFAGESVVSGMTLFARWEKVTYEVKFATGGGSAVPAKTVVHGEKISEPARPVFEGYDFAGWFKDAEGTIPWDFNSESVFAGLTLYARWTPVAAQMVEVVFDSAGGSAVPSKNIIKGEKITEPAPPIREGQNFAGWYKEAACIDPWNFAVEAVTGSLTLYARWIPVTVQTVEVRFDSTGGSVVTAKTVVPGEKIVEPAVPVRAGYDFAGWYKEPECLNIWNFSTDAVNVSVTLYARWKIRSLVVLFDSTGGSEVASQTINHGARVGEPVAPVRSNHDFAGWYKEAALLNAWNFSVDTVTANLTLFARWTPRMSEVRFDSTGGSVVATQTVAYGGKLTEPASPVRDGYNFAGWYKESALVNPWYFATDIVTGNLKLYARWIAKTAQTFEVQFDSTGGSSLTARTVIPGEKITEPAAPVRDGYIFGGWYKEAALTTAWNFTTDTVSANTTLYARWTQKVVEVRFDTAGGNSVASQAVVPGGKVVEPSVPVRPGYTFGGWYKEAALTTTWNFTTDTVTVNATIYARWVPNAVEVRFDTAGGSTVASQTVLYGGKATEPVVPVRDGYTFGGWYKEAALTTAWNFSTDTVTANTTLYASWNKKAFEVQFDAAGGSTVATQTVTYGGNLSEPVSPTREGYNFGGWYKESALINLWNFAGDIVTGNLTLYARWIAKTVQTVEVSFDSSGGSGLSAKVVIPGERIVAPTAPVREGYTFGGWYKEAALTTVWNFSTDTVTASTTLYARWTPKNFEVQFNVAGGSAVASQTIVYGGKVTEPAAPVLAGYTFDGWYKEATLTNAWNFSTDTVTANTTLYARWTQKTFEVQFNVAGGSAVASQTIVYGGKVTEPAAPVLVGYTFGGWYKEAALTAAWNFATDTVTANTTLYASWTQLFTLSYAAAANGSLTGTLSQTVASGSSGTAVTAVPDTGYRFAGWSDGSLANPRTDGNVSVAISVTANFAAKDATVLADGRYAWSENSGWLDFSATQASATAKLGKTGWLAGMIWHENIGWIKLGASGSTPPYANNAADNWGVNLDAAGKLSGYAWSENAGWINFSATSANAVLDQDNGLVTGSAWAENLGWVKFSGSLYSVKFKVN